MPYHVRVTCHQCGEETTHVVYRSITEIRPHVCPYPILAGLSSGTSAGPSAEENPPPHIFPLDDDKEA